MKRKDTIINKILTIGASVLICTSLMGCKSSKVDSKKSENKIVSEANNEENKENKKPNSEKVANDNNHKKIVVKTEANIKDDMDTQINTKVQKGHSVHFNKYVEENARKVINNKKNRQNKEEYITKKNINIKNKISNTHSKNNNVIKKSTNQIKKKEPEIKQELSYKLVYSSLYDSSTQNEIAKLLKDNNIKSENIDRFIKTVQRYNSIVGPLKTSTNGFKIINSKAVNYDEVEEHITNQWYKHSNDPVDINCRLTAFSLFKDNIMSKGESEDKENNLMFDLDAIERNPLCKFKNEDVKKFINLYAHMPAELPESMSAEDIKNHANTIKKEWQNRKIKFINNSKISMINGFLHDKYTKTLFCGHSGIFVKTDNGFLFIEKYSFLTPYQVSKFNTKEEVKKYLLDRLDIGFGENISKPIIMENDELM